MQGDPRRKAAQWRHACPAHASGWGPGPAAHSRGVKTVKEVLERRGLSAAERKICPVLAVGSGIIWMSGVEVESTPGLQLTVEPLRDTGEAPVLQVVPDTT